MGKLYEWMGFTDPLLSCQGFCFLIIMAVLIISFGSVGFVVIHAIRMAGIMRIVRFLILLLFKYIPIAAVIYALLFVFALLINLPFVTEEQVREGFKLWFSWEGVKGFLSFIIFIFILLGVGSSLSQSGSRDNTGGC